jgi:hypothetical protein
MKKSEMITALHREVPLARLVAAMALVMQKRRERAGLDPDHFAISDAGNALDEFLASCSKRQLKMLREIAVGLRHEGSEKITVQ